MKRATVFAICVLPVASCVTEPRFTEVGPARQTVGGAYKIDPQIAWSRLVSDKFEIWTVDGPALDEVSFATGIADGEVVVLLSPQDQAAALGPASAVARLPQGHDPERGDGAGDRHPDQYRLHRRASEQSSAF